MGNGKPILKKKLNSSRVAKSSANRNNTSKAGVFVRNLNNTSSNRNTNIGSHLKFQIKTVFNLFQKKKLSVLKLVSVTLPLGKT